MEFALNRDRDAPFYSNEKHSDAWQAASTTEQSEILATCSNACRNVSCFNLKNLAPILPDISGNGDVSIYFLGFLILKVISYRLFLFCFYSQFLTLFFEHAFESKTDVDEQFSAAARPPRKALSRGGIPPAYPSFSRERRSGLQY